MDTVLVVQRYFSGSSTMDLPKVVFSKNLVIVLSVQTNKTKHLMSVVFSISQEHQIKLKTTT